jgi:hypothetical protein
MGSAVVFATYALMAVVAGCSISREDLHELYLVLRFESVWEPLVVVASLSDSISGAFIGMQIAPRTFMWMLRDKVFLQQKLFLFFASGRWRTRVCVVRVSR